MAELHVQKKETAVWPWIVGLVLVGAVLWFVFARSDTNDRASSTTADTMYQTQPAAPVGARPPGTP